MARATRVWERKGHGAQPMNLPHVLLPSTGVRPSQKEQRKKCYCRETVTSGNQVGRFTQALSLNSPTTLVAK